MFATNTCTVKVLSCYISEQENVEMMGPEKLFFSLCFLYAFSGWHTP